MTTEQNDDSAAEKYQQDLRDLAKNISLDSFPFYKRSNGEPINAKSIFLAGILHERKKHEWVSVRIRQPEKPGNYLVYRIPRQYTEGVMAGRWAYSYAPITTRSWNGERWQSDQEVTHWQPLSNPPKELEEK